MVNTNAVNGEETTQNTKPKKIHAYHDARNGDENHEHENELQSSSTLTTISDHEDGTNIVEYTQEELNKYGNGNNDEGLLLLLSLYVRVYDVSEGYKYYGHGGKYHLFAGRDVTKALSTGCLAVSCLGPRYAY